MDRQALKDRFEFSKIRRMKENFEVARLNAITIEKRRNDAVHKYYSNPVNVFVSSMSNSERHAFRRSSKSVKQMTVDTIKEFCCPATVMRAMDKINARFA